MTTKFLLLLLAKAAAIGLLGSLGMALWMMAYEPFGLPVTHAHVDGFIAGWWSAVLIGAAVSSLAPPREDSSPFYKFIYHFGHLGMSRANTYVSHTSVGKLLIRDNAEKK